MPTEAPKTTLVVRRDIVDCAVAPAHLQRTDLIDVLDEAPFFEFLMDAKAAIQGQDWARSILYAATSIDAAARLVMDREIDRAKRERAHDPGLRFRMHEGQQVDPVLSRLTSGEPRIRNIMDEIMMYLRGKSLRFDDPGLFDEMTRVYGTRNKLVHRAAADSREQNAVTVDEQGASRALTVATKVLTWLGFDVARFAPRRRQFVKAGRDDWEATGLFAESNEAKR